MFESLSKPQKLSLAIGIGLIVIAAGVASYFVFNPSYSVLTDSLGPEASSKLIASLEKQGVNVHLSSDGSTISVPENELHQARVKLNSLAVVPDQTVGLELYDSVEYGMTEHAQKVNYQRAIQGELERTLTKLSFIKSARVHITFAERQFFKNARQKAKAAVTVQTEEKANLSARQVSAVKNMVAAAVSELEAEDVTLLDQNGNLLSIYSDSAMIVDNAISHKNSLENALKRKVDRVLGLYFEYSDFATSVDVTLDLTQRKETLQRVLPVGEKGSGVVARKNERTVTREQENTPDPGNIESSSEVEYLHSSKKEEKVFRPGQVTQLSVAVALLSNISEEKRNTLERLIGASVGINRERGDILELSVFKPLSTAPQEEVKLKSAEGSGAGSESKKAGYSALEVEKQDSSIDIKWFLVLAFILVASNFITYRAGRKLRLTNEERKTLLLELNRSFTGQEGAIDER